MLVTARTIADVQATLRMNSDFNAALAEHGLWFAPDPSSRAISTVGGNIATNAGGLLCSKYGATREAVLGLKVVLVDGCLLILGHRSVKGVTGFDLTALMIGSEGILGVIVEATVRVRRQVAGTIATIGVWFPSVGQAAGASAAITASGQRPAASRHKTAGCWRPLRRSPATSSLTWRHDAWPTCLYRPAALPQKVKPLRPWQQSPLSAATPN